MRDFVRVILIYCLIITQTTEGHREQKELKKQVDLLVKEFKTVYFEQNQECLEQSEGTEYFDRTDEECKPCVSLENSHERYILCPEYQLKKANTELEKADKELEKANKQLEKKLELMEKENRKQDKTLSCVVQANHKSYYDEETYECVSCDNCEIGEECQMICAGSKGADPVLILTVILIILVIVAIVIIVFVVRYYTRLQNVEQNNNNKCEKTSVRKRLYEDPSTDVSEKTSVLYTACPSVDRSSLSSKESFKKVESSMDNTTCTEDNASVYIRKERAGPSSCHLGIVDEQNESSEESTGYEKTPERKLQYVAHPQTESESDAGTEAYSLSCESVESSMDNTTCTEDNASVYIRKETAGPSSCHLGIVDEQNESSEESTGYPLLKCMKEKHKKEYEALGKHDPPMFDLYPKCAVSKIHRTHPDCSNLRDACKGEIKQGDAAALINAMQEKERLLIYNIVGNKTQVAISIANAAVDKGYHCILKTFPSQQENQSTIEPTYDKEVYFIKHEIDYLPKLDMSDKPDAPLLEGRSFNCDEEPPLPAYNYLQEEDVQKKCLVIVQDCDGIDKNQKVSQKPCDYLGNVIGGLMFANARVIIISCNPSSCPAVSFQCNLPNRYASVRKTEQLSNLSDRHASVSKTE